MSTKVDDTSSWTTLLSYYFDCLREENRLRYVIKPNRIGERCWFLPGADASLMDGKSSGVAIEYERDRDVRRFQIFVLGRPGRPSPEVCFGYPFYVDSDRKLMPLLYVRVSPQRTEAGVWIAPDDEPQVNFAALWEVLPGDSRSICLDDVLAEFDAVEAAEGQTVLDAKQKLLVSHLTELSGRPIERLGSKQFDRRYLRRHTVVDCPLLFQVRPGYTNQLLKELRYLRDWHGWEPVGSALRQSLTVSDDYSYPQVPALAHDDHVYVVPANDRQRKAVVASESCPLTVVTGPPGTGKSQLILNTVADAVLRGETVLVASRNNKAVEVIRERFFGQVDYPGIVRTGKREFRKELPREMRRAVARIPGEQIESRLKDLLAERTRILDDIKEQHKVSQRIQRLRHDRRVYRSELELSLDGLPERLRRAMRESRVSMGRADSIRVLAAIDSLADDARDLIESREALTGQIERALLSNEEELEFLRELGDVEERVGASIELRRPAAVPTTFSGLQRYLGSWRCFLAALSLEEEILRTEEIAKSLDRELQSTIAELPEGLSTAVDQGHDDFDKEEECSLRESLEHYRSVARAAQQRYCQASDQLCDLREGSAFIDAWLKFGRVTWESVSSPLCLVRTHRLLQSKAEVLQAQSLLAETDEVTSKLESLVREKQSKMAELRQELAGLDEALAESRALVPAVLLAEIDVVAEAADPERWRIELDQWHNLDQWAHRVAADKLTIGERIRSLLQQSWALNTLGRRLGDLISSELIVPVANLVEHPSVDAGFETWADYTSEMYRFVNACTLTASRSHLQRACRRYQAGMEQRITEASDKVTELETKLGDLLEELPDGLGSVMLEDAWPREELKPQVLGSLDRVARNVEELYSAYWSWVEGLDGLHQRCGKPDSLVPVLQRLPRDKESTWIDLSEAATPSLVEEAIDSWLRLSEAIELKHDLEGHRQQLAEDRGKLETVWGEVPGGTRDLLNWSGMHHSVESRVAVNDRLDSFQENLAEQMGQWRDLKDQATAVFQHNDLSVRAVERVLRLADEDARYPILGNRTVDTPEQLLDNLAVWRTLIRVCVLAAQVKRVHYELRRGPTLQEARQRLSELERLRVDVGGRVMTETWRETASRLEASEKRGIMEYVRASEALAEGYVPNYGELRSQCERHFGDVLKLFPVWLTTNLSTQDLPLSSELFDLVVIDEASQCDIPSALPLLFRGKRLVIIGDQMQLRHIASLPDATHKQISERHNIGAGTDYDYKKHSLFDFVKRSVEGAPEDIVLNEHYRSHADIINFAAEHIYKKKFHIRTNLDHIPTSYRECGCGVYWLDVNGSAERRGPGEILNVQEVKAVRELLKLLDSRLRGTLDPTLERHARPPASIGVVTPFREQADQIGQGLRSLHLGRRAVSVGTVHTYQGDEQDLMIFSTVATEELLRESPRTYGFMCRSPNLLNVAVTRARLTLLVVGDHDFFMDRPTNDLYHQLARYAFDMGHVYSSMSELTIWQPPEEGASELAEQVIRPEKPYSNRLTLRRLLASCEDYVWWYDLHMSGNALDALAHTFCSNEFSVKEIRLLTDKARWAEQSRNPTSCLPRKEVNLLRSELMGRGIELRLALFDRDRMDPMPHDRYLFAANCSVNMPPINTIYQTIARISEFKPSSLRGEDFQGWWERAEEIDLPDGCLSRRREGDTSPPSTARQKARVVKYLDTKGYGFLKGGDLEDDLFFHISNVRERDSVEEGEYLEFAVDTGKHGRLQAVDLVVVGEQ